MTAEATMNKAAAILSGRKVASVTIDFTVCDQSTAASSIVSVPAFASSVAITPIGSVSF